MKLFQVLAVSALFTVVTAMHGQTPAPAPATERDTSTRARAEAKMTDRDATYGRIKELTPGQKVVINVDNAPDKTFDLADKDVAVKMGKGLKVGDTVKVVEHDKLGKTQSVMITKHSGGGVKHGDTGANAKP